MPYEINRLVNCRVGLALNPLMIGAVIGTPINRIAFQ